MLYVAVMAFVNAVTVVVVNDISFVNAVVVVVTVYISSQGCFRCY